MIHECPMVGTSMFYVLSVVAWLAVLFCTALLQAIRQYWSSCSRKCVVLTFILETSRPRPLESTSGSFQTFPGFS